MPTEDSSMNEIIQKFVDATLPQRMTRLTEAVRTCQACPLGVSGRGVPGTWVDGAHRGLRMDSGTQPNPPPTVMILGEAPGGVEMARGAPFVGQSGELLRSLLKEVGLESYYLSNMVRHQPPKVKGKQQAPDKVAVAACAPFLRAEFELVKPTHLILLGGIAAKLVVPGQFKVGSVVNTTTVYQIEQVYYEGSGIPTLTLYHPSYFLRNRTSPWIQKAVREWKQALRLFLGDKAPTYQIEEVKCEVHS